MGPHKVSVIFGTRPEAIKLASVILALRMDPAFDCRVCVTGQHRQMLDQVLEVFQISPDTDLNLMQPNQTLGGFTARALEALDAYLAVEKPRLVLVQGDTTTVFCATLAAFYHKIPVGHVEAGLRTGNLSAPWPEEANRVLTTRLASLHFAPTKHARDALFQEGVSHSSVILTGNTVVDALMLALKRIQVEPPTVPGLPEFLQPHSKPQNGSVRLVLITGHRRENFGEGFECICRAIAELAARFQDVHFVYPVHLNPNVREPVMRVLGGPRSQVRSNVHLIEPLPYLSFVALMNRATLILTDSGGIQEEAPSLGKPVLIMRETTERPEAVEAGCARLVGADLNSILKETSSLLLDEPTRSAMTRGTNPYGDGQAAQRIVNACREFLDIGRSQPVSPIV